VRVVIADDALLTREGIARVLERGGVDVVGQAGEAVGLHDLVDRLRPDLAIIDIRMPPFQTDEGLVAALRVRTEHPDIGVLVLSHFVEPGYAMRLITEHAEATGYLLKDRVSDPVVLLDAVRRIKNGECVIDPTIVGRLLNRARPAGPLESLTAREREVLSLVAEGQSNRSIASALTVSDRTVETHTASIFEKLGLNEDSQHNRRVLAVLAFLGNNPPPTLN
jgi:DNA-binding NarL/FixJ family response regulator